MTSREPDSTRCTFGRKNGSQAHVTAAIYISQLCVERRDSETFCFRAQERLSSTCDGSDLYFPAVRRAARFRDVALSRAGVCRKEMIETPRTVGNERGSGK